MIIAKSYESTTKTHKNSMYGVDCMIDNIDIQFKDPTIVSTECPSNTTNEMHPIGVITTLKNRLLTKYDCLDQYINIISDWEPSENLAKGSQ